MPYSDAQKKALLEEFRESGQSQRKFCEGEGRPSQGQFSKWVKHSEEYGVDPESLKNRERVKDDAERYAGVSRKLAGKPIGSKYPDAKIADMIIALYSPRDGRRSLVESGFLPSARDKFPDVQDSDYIVLHLRHLKAGVVTMGPLTQQALEYAGIPLEDRTISLKNGETIISGKKIADVAKYAPRGGLRDEMANTTVSAYASPFGPGYPETDSFLYYPANIAVSPYTYNSGSGYAQTDSFSYYPANTAVSPFVFDSTSDYSQNYPVATGGHEGESSEQVLDGDQLRQYYASLAAGEASASHHSMTGKSSRHKHSHSHSHAGKPPRR
ncbi:hypothetical protein [Streptomyces sp. NPDC006012]|uniref:hypothetical protein n=1 Tax=Streptomyces sp. NPDC006012 TaxID=3364739 RepID=UPI003685C5CC